MSEINSNYLGKQLLNDALFTWITGPLERMVESLIDKKPLRGDSAPAGSIIPDNLGLVSPGYFIKFPKEVIYDFDPFHAHQEPADSLPPWYRDESDEDSNKDQSNFHMRSLRSLVQMCISSTNLTLNALITSEVGVRGEESISIKSILDLLNIALTSFMVMFFSSRHNYSYSSYFDHFFLIFT